MTPDTIEAAQAAPTKAVDVFAMLVHPAAAVFPMLADDEMAALMVDIKANGLRHPLVVKDGVLIDGRCRREACRRAGIEPATTELAGDDVEGHILSENIRRRHLTKGQIAMAVARMFPEPAVLKRPGVCSLIAKEQNSGLLSQARTVIKWAPDLVNVVTHGTRSLEIAYRTAFAAKASKGASTPPPPGEVSNDGPSPDVTPDASVEAVIPSHEQAAPDADMARAKRTLAEVRAVVARLPKTRQKTFDRIVAKQLKAMQHEREADIRRAADAMIPERVAFFEERLAACGAEHKSYVLMRQGIRAFISEDDYRFMLNALHPDRAPDREKLTECFHIVKRLEPYIEAAKRGK